MPSFMNRGRVETGFPAQRFFAAFVCALFLLFAESSHAIEWERLYGSPADDYGKSIAVDSNGNVYVAGYTEGGLSGASSDLFVTKYKPDGKTEWTKSFGTSEDDFALGLTLDSEGSVYVTGYTYGAFDKMENEGNSDIFIAKFSQKGNLDWIKQLGTRGGDIGSGIAAGDDGYIYITGYTTGFLAGNKRYKENYDWDSFIAKYDSKGRVQWIKTLDSAGNLDYGHDIAVYSGGGVFVAGVTTGDLDKNKNSGATDMFVAKYDFEGNKEWVRLLGSKGDDAGYGVTVDPKGGVYVAGTTSGSLGENPNMGGTDGFIAKYDLSGNILWIKQVGTPKEDSNLSITSDSKGNIYLGGTTLGDFDGKENAGSTDIFIVKYDPAGKKLWSQLMGGAQSDNINGISADSNGKVYIAGYASVKAEETKKGGGVDILVAKLEGDLTPPNTASLPKEGIFGKAMRVQLDCDDASGTGCDKIFFTTDGTAPNEKFGLYTGEIPIDRNVTLRYFSVDKSGNKEAVKTASYIIDTQPPRGISVSINGGDESTDIGNLVLSISGNDDYGVAGYFLSESLDEPSLADFQTVDPSADYSDEISYIASAGYDLKKIYVWFVDLAGNVSSASSDSIEIVEPISVGEWMKLFGGKQSDVGRDVTVDIAGNVFVTGVTSSGLEDGGTEGNSDAFIVKYDTKGKIKWSRLIGTASYDFGTGVAVDSKGSVYVTGSTGGDLDTNKNKGFLDAFIVKYDADGLKEWTQLLGTPESDWSRSIAVDLNGNVYITGDTGGDLLGNENKSGADIFIAKYNTLGNRMWTKIVGAPNYGYGIDLSVDNDGNVYVIADTNISLESEGSSDVLIIKYDTDGNKVWSGLLGSDKHDYGKGVSVNENGDVYVLGNTGGNLDGNSNKGKMDVFIAKFDDDGKKIWTKLLGADKSDIGLDIAADSSGGFYVIGIIGGGMKGNTVEGNVDVFVSRYDADGNKLSEELIGSEGYDFGAGIAIDPNGAVYITGHTKGDLEGKENAGGNDIFLWKM